MAGTIRIGITGGIGSGKSVVCRLLEMVGVPVYTSDLEAKRLMRQDPAIRRGLIALVGSDVYDGEELNRPLLASYLFGHAEHARRVNAIVHPRVKEDFRQWVQRHAACPVVGMESAILIEAGFTDVVDCIVMVYAPEEVRIERAVCRDDASREQIIRRIRSQMNDEEKRCRADFVIDNGGSLSLIEQVRMLVTKTFFIRR